MYVNDPVGDMLTRIRNGQMVRLASVVSPSSKLRKGVLEVLQREGYIRTFTESLNKVSGFNELKIELKYGENNLPAITEVKRVSTPGRRVYSSIKKLLKFYNGLGIAILSTPKGVMSDYEARLENVGGEVLCKVF